MTPREVFGDYLALKAHFKPGSYYNYHKYGGKGMRTSAFETHRDARIFVKISKHRDPHGLMLRCISRNPAAYIRDVASEAAYEDYIEWARWQQAPAHWVVQEVNGIPHDHFNELFMHEGGRLPPLLYYVTENRISLDTLCVLMRLVEPQYEWNKRNGPEGIADHPLWSEIRWRAERYDPFLKGVDINTIKQKLIERYA